MLNSITAIASIVARRRRSFNLADGERPASSIFALISADQGTHDCRSVISGIHFPHPEHVFSRQVWLRTLSHNPLLSLSLHLLIHFLHLGRLPIALTH